MQDIPDYDPPEYGEEDKDILLTREKQISPNWDTNKILDKYDLPSPESIENDSYSSSQFYDLLELATKKSNQLACVQTITKLWLVPSAKQRRDPCSGPPTDSTNYRKCVSNFPLT